MRGAPSASGPAQRGHNSGRLVANEIDRRHGESAYVKTRDGFEVDFLARYPNGTRELIQVCADPSPAETAARELRSLAAAASEHPRVKRRLLVLTRDQTLGLVAKGVSVEPAYEWMLEPDNRS